MSWAGTGGFFGGALNGDRPLRGATADPTNLDELRRFAYDAYTKGRLSDAAAAVTAILAAARVAGIPLADDFLFAGFVHHANSRIAEGIAVLREGIARYTQNPSLQENMAVMLLAEGDVAGSIEACQTALTLGSESPNVYDCLCDAQQRNGHPDRAVTAGRLALQAKDRLFGDAAPIVAMPTARPPAFDAEHPERNVIAYALWGNQPRYHVPLLENARIRPHLFPEWIIRVYHDQTVDPAYLAQLAAHGVQLVPMRLPLGVPVHRGLLWRFEVIADPNVQRFLIRDADSLLTVKERVAVDDWLRSDFHFHAMRDWYSHTDLLLAGMWGGVGGILPSPAVLLRDHTPWRMENDHADQDLLSQRVWPAIRRDVLIHDSIFAPCLGSAPFPPFGALPAGHHIGQNAFLHFSKSG